MYAGGHTDIHKHPGLNCMHHIPLSLPKAALVWCLAVQEVAMHIKWPESATTHWATEWCQTSQQQEGCAESGRQILFRGPR